MKCSLGEDCGVTQPEVRLNSTSEVAQKGRQCPSLGTAPSRQVHQHVAAKMRRPEALVSGAPLGLPTMSISLLIAVPVFAGFQVQCALNMQAPYCICG